MIYLLLILLVFTTRSVYLNSDTVPIQELHNEDEGNYVHNIRNYVVEGTFIKDQTNFIFLSPVFSFLIYPIIKTLGVHIYSFRLINSITSTLTILLGFAFLSKEVSKRAGIVFLILLTSDFLYLIHNRIAMPETTSAFFMLTSLVTIYYGIKKQKATLFGLAGLLTAMAYLTKSSAIIIVGVALLTILANPIQLLFKKKLGKKQIVNYIVTTIIFLTSFFVPVFLYYFFIIKSYPELFDIVYKNLIVYHRPYIRTHLLTIKYHKEELKEFFEGGEGFIWKYLFPYIVIIGLGIKHILKSKNAKLFLIWVLIGLGYFYILWYKPARWFVPNLVPIISLVAIVIAKYPKKIAALIVVFVVFYNFSFSYKYIYSNPTYFLLNASNKIEEKTREKTILGDSLLLMDNSKSLGLNDYFLEDIYSRTKIDLFLEIYKYPQYFVRGGSSYSYFFESNNDYQPIYKTRSSNLGREVTLYEYNPKFE